MTEAKTTAPDRIARLFQETRAAGRTAVIPFVPAGWPELSATEGIVRAAVRGGADAIELGLPFSDPLADGATNQRAYHEAILAGSTAETLLQTVTRLRAGGIEIPIIVMGYVNPMMAYGFERWTRAAARAGIDGLIVVDLPPGEAGELEEAARRHSLHLIYLVAPTSDAERLSLVARHASGFVYCVSLTGTTGARAELPSDLAAFIGRVRSHIDLPLAVGFGISERRHVLEVAELADAAVVGSAFVRTISEAAPDRREAAVREFVEGLAGRSGAQEAAPEPGRESACR